MVKFCAASAAADVRKPMKQGVSERVFLLFSFSYVVKTNLELQHPDAIDYSSPAEWKYGMPPQQ